MIYLGFVFDYLISLLLPIPTYFLIAHFDKNRFFSVFVVGILLDYLYHKILLCLGTLLFFYGILKCLRIKKKYAFWENMIVFFLFFHITYFSFGCTLQTYARDLLMATFLQIIYLKVSKLLLK